MNFEDTTSTEKYFDFKMETAGGEVTYDLNGIDGKILAIADEAEYEDDMNAKGKSPLSGT